MITYPVVQHESISCVPPQMKVSPPQWPPKMKTPESPLLVLLFNFVMYCIVSTIVVAFEINIYSK